MSIREIKTGKEARDLLLNGMKQVFNVVGQTIGPKGNNGVIQDPHWPPIITNDGVRLARQISLRDRFEDCGAKLIQEVAIKTNDIAGDGTTTATILCYSIATTALKSIDEHNFKPQILRKYLEKWTDTVVKFLDDNKQEIKTEFDKLQAIATISAQDPIMGKAIAEAISKIGEYGIITIEEGINNKNIENIYVDGFQINTGIYSKSFFLKENQTREDFDNIPIFVTNHVIDRGFLSGFLDKFDKHLTETNSIQIRKMIVFANDFTHEAMIGLLGLKVSERFRIIPIKNPFIGIRNRELCEDLALIMGAQFISNESFITLDKAGVESIGFVDKLILKERSCEFIKNEVQVEKIQAKVEDLNSKLEEAPTENDRDDLRERIAKLNQGVCIMKVNAVTDIELKEKKDKMEDAINSTKAAIEDGIIPGGGLALFRASEFLKVQDTDGVIDQVARDIIVESIKLPLKMILENCGLDPEEVINKITGKAFSSGYDALEDKYCDLWKSNIIDPVKATKAGLKNAMSVVSAFLTTGSVIVNSVIQIKE